MTMNALFLNLSHQFFIPRSLFRLQTTWVYSFHAKSIQCWCRWWHIITICFHSSFSGLSLHVINSQTFSLEWNEKLKVPVAFVSREDPSITLSSEMVLSSGWTLQSFNANSVHMWGSHQPCTLIDNFPSITVNGQSHGEQLLSDLDELNRHASESGEDIPPDFPSSSSIMTRTRVRKTWVKLERVAYSQVREGNQTKDRTWLWSRGIHPDSKPR